MTGTPFRASAPRTIWRRPRGGQCAAVPTPPDARFTMANERTFLAWNRTALALIGGGLAVEQFLDTGRTARLALAIPLILLGAVVAASSYSRWRANEDAMARGSALPPSRMPLVIST